MGRGRDRGGEREESEERNREREGEGEKVTDNVREGNWKRCSQSVSERQSGKKRRKERE